MMEQNSDKTQKMLPPRVQNVIYTQEAQLPTEVAQEVFMV